MAARAEELDRVFTCPAEITRRTFDPARYVNLGDVCPDLARVFRRLAEADVSSARTSLGRAESGLGLSPWPDAPRAHSGPAG
jgi:hypothetical protein